MWHQLRNDPIFRGLKLYHLISLINILLLRNDPIFRGLKRQYYWQTEITEQLRNDPIFRGLKLCYHIAFAQLNGITK